MFDPRNNLANEVSDQLIAHFGDKVFRTIIPRNIRLAEAPSFGKPVLFHDKESRGALAYLALAGEMIRREEVASGLTRAAAPPPALAAAVRRDPAPRRGRARRDRIRRPASRPRRSPRRTTRRCTIPRRRSRRFTIHRRERPRMRSGTRPGPMAGRTPTSRRWPRPPPRRRPSSPSCRPLMPR